MKKFIKDEVPTKIMPLKEVIKEEKIKQIDLIKIDTEGFEYNTLVGMDRDIKKVRFILFEHHYDNMIIKNYKFKDIHTLLIDNGFQKVYKIKKANWDIDVPKYKTIGKEWLKSQVSRAFLPSYFPEFKKYLWISCKLKSALTFVLNHKLEKLRANNSPEKLDSPNPKEKVFTLMYAFRILVSLG